MAQAGAVPRLRSGLFIACYLLSVLAVIGGFALICRYGQSLSAAAAPTVIRAPGGEPAADHALLHVLAALAAVIITGRALGWIFRYVGQPAVIGEVVAGILLGPSLLGRAFPEAAEVLLPASVAPYLEVIAQIAVVLYMFLVGLEFDAATLQKQGHSAIVISHASMTAPFLLGGVLALWLYPRLSSTDVPFDVFALFLGVSMSVTAFPVLARILTDRGLSRTRLGTIALTCAAAGDVTAWCLLAFVVAVAKAQVSSVFVGLTSALLYLVAMFLLVRPILSRLARTNYFSELHQGALAAVFVTLLVSSLTTEWIGIHAIFGAFVLGAVIPHDSVIARQLPEKLQNIISVLFLPAFFAFAGMRTDIGRVSGIEDWLICGVIVLVATLGKLGGTTIAARATGLAWRDAAAIGSLMNTRGLMELIVLNIGLDLGVISTKLFAMLVVMALATTLSTAPMLQLLQRNGPGRRRQTTPT